MNVGTYFMYCPVSSGAQTHVFRYKLFETLDKNTYLSRFPVYLLFDKSKIYVGFSANLSINDRKDNFDRREKKHFNEEIISVPITQYIRRNRDLFSCFIHDGMHSPVMTGNAYQEISSHLVSHEGPHKFYNEEEDPPTGKLPISPQQIFLDFLFDLYHSSVFDVQPGIDAVRDSISGHYLCNAILAKQEYRLCRAELKEEADKNKTGLIPAMYIERYINARARFLEVLDDDNGYYLFEVDRCFDPSVEEMNRLAGDEVFKRIRPKTLEARAIFDINIIDANKRMVDFFIDRVAIYKAILFLIQSVKTWRKVLIILFLGLLIWIWNAQPLKNSWNKAIFGVALFGLLYSVLLPLAFTSFDAIWLWVCKRLFEKKKHRPGGRRMRIHNSGSTIFFPFMSYGIIAAWCAYIPISEDVLKLSLNATVFSADFLNLMMICIALMLIICYSTIKFKVPEYRSGNYNIVNSSFLCFSGVSFSIFFGIFIMHFNTARLLSDKGEEYIPNGYYSKSLAGNNANFKRLENLRNNFDHAIAVRADTPRISTVKFTEKDSLISFLSSPAMKRYSTGVLQELSKDSLLGHYRRGMNDEFEALFRCFYRDSIEMPVVRLADELENRTGPQYIAHLEFCGFRCFFFPRLLLLYSFMAFYLGYLLQFIISFSNKHS